MSTAENELKNIVEGVYTFKMLVKRDIVSVLLARRLDYAIALVADPLSTLYVLRYLPKDMLRELIEKKLLRYDITARVSVKHGVEVAFGKSRLRCKARAKYKKIGAKDMEARLYRVEVYECKLE